MSAVLTRVSLISEKDPNQRLADFFGEKFAAYRRAWAEAESGRAPLAPLHLDIDVTTACNLACPMCPAGNSGHNFPGFKKGLRLSRTIYRKALAEGAAFGLPSLRLGLTGEPLLEPDIHHWVREAREAGIMDVSLITNGQLLTRAVSRKLIEAGLTRLMISVDAAGPEVYARARPGGDWAKLLQNIGDFVRQRGESAGPTPLLRLSFVEMKVNERDRRPFETLFGPLADYLSFQPYQNILGSPETDFGLKEAAPGGNFCPEPLTRLAVHADGGLFPCCSDFGRLKPLGNLARQGLTEIWRSPAAEIYRGPGGLFKAPCRDCTAVSRKY